MNINISRIIKMLLIVAAGILVGFLLLINVYALSTGKMISHVKESREDLLEEGDRMKWGGYLTYSDGFTDSIMISKAIYNGSGSLAEKSMMNYGIQAEGYSTMTEQLIAALDGTGNTYVKDYPTYWHGYLAVLKPLLMFFNIGEIRMINMILQTILLVMCVILVYENLGRRYLAALIPGILFMNPVTAAISFQFATMYYILLITLIIMLMYRVKLSEKQTYSYLFLVCGMACAFFDFLTVPVVALGIPLVFFILMEGVKNFADGIKELITKSLAWSLGYIGMWSGKWVLASIITKSNIIQKALEQIRYRSGSEFYKNEGDVFGRLDGIKENLTVLGNNPLVLGFIIAAALVIIMGIFTKRTKNVSRKEAAILLIIALYPFAWYIAALNHSALHSFITWRDLSVTVTAVMAALINFFK